jgi:hypothetical protein
MNRLLPRDLVRLLLGVVSVLVCAPPASAQQILQVLEPGIGFARFKQWAVESQLVFENFTKDSLVVRDTGLTQWETVRIQARFCGGDDYSGKASNIIIQQLFDAKLDVLTVQRDYVEFLTGRANVDGKLPGTFSGRRDRKDGDDGLAFSQEGDKGYWEVGLFKKVVSRDKVLAVLQTIRRRDSVCQ